MPFALIHDETIEILHYLWFNLYATQGYQEACSERPHLRGRPESWSLSVVREQLMYLERRYKDFQIQGDASWLEENGYSNFAWMFAEKEIEIIPIYNEAIALVQLFPILPAKRIPSIISFLTAGGKFGIDVENHGNGYHFHYGEIKKNRFKRFDVLLTFSKFDKKPKGKQFCLYSEPHAAGKCIHVDIATIGLNKRRPIYHECVSQMTKRGMETFMAPSKDSSVFYPIS